MEFHFGNWTETIFLTENNILLLSLHAVKQSDIKAEMPFDIINTHRSGASPGSIILQPTSGTRSHYVSYAPPCGSVRESEDGGGNGMQQSFAFGRITKR